MGRSLLYSLAQNKANHFLGDHYENIHVFSEDDFYSPCSLHSTATVSLRGVTKGVSPLGDIIFEGQSFLRKHVEHMKPSGVWRVHHIISETQNFSKFSKRFPQFLESSDSSLLKNKAFFVEEEALIIDPGLYLNWLLDQSLSVFSSQVNFIKESVNHFSFRDDLNGQILLKTHSQKEFVVDKVMFCGGSYNRLWGVDELSDQKVTSRPVPGHYLEFSNIDWASDSYILSLNEYSLVWNHHTKKLLMGSTSSGHFHQLVQKNELIHMYDYLAKNLHITLPPFEKAKIKVGVREKGKKRRPYFLKNKNAYFIGGLYKNGFGISLKLAHDFINQIISNDDKTHSNSFFFETV